MPTIQLLALLYSRSDIKEPSLCFSFIPTVMQESSSHTETYDHVLRHILPVRYTALNNFLSPDRLLLTLLKATIWPEPFCFEKTADEKKESKEFAYSDEGLLALHQWLCDSYDTKKEKWEHARDFPLDGIMS